MTVSVGTLVRAAEKQPRQYKGLRVPALAPDLPLGSGGLMGQPYTVPEIVPYVMATLSGSGIIASVLGSSLLSVFACREVRC